MEAYFFFVVVVLQLKVLYYNAQMRSIDILSIYNILVGYQWTQRVSVCK